MNSTHEDAVLNFDLDFLHPTTNNIPVPAPKLKYITQLKRRIIRVDALQNHSNTINQELSNKNKELEEIKKKLESTTQEYTQTSLDYKEALENSARCERENVKLTAIIKKLEEERFKAVNDYDAIKSHVAQLEQLVKQQERKLESQDKIDKKKTDKVIEERISAKTKEHEKELLLWKKKYETLQKEFQDLKCSYSKLNEEVSKKAENVCNEITNVSMSPDLSDNEDDMSVDVTISVNHQHISQNNADTSQKLQGPVHRSMELDNESINEAVCVDLGYGSSLASSDNEKGLNSPDYVFSPINADNREIHRTRKLVTTATSPIQTLTTAEIATSPIMLVEMIDVAVSPQNIIIETPDDNETQHLPITADESVASPRKSNSSPFSITEIAATPVKELKPVSPTNIQVNTDDTKETDSKTDESLENLPNTDIMQEKLYSKTDETLSSLPDIDRSQEKQYLESNNSTNMHDDYSADIEIEMILNKMRFNHKLITPIPRTPGKSSRRSESTEGHLTHSTCDVKHSSCVDAAIARTQATTAREEAASAREEAVKTREDNVKLMTTLNHLMKEMFTIKSFLKSRMAMPDMSLELNENYVLSNIACNNATSSNISNNDNTDEINPVYTSQPIDRWPDKRITVISEEIIKPADTDNMRNKHDQHTTHETLQNKIQNINLEKSLQQNMPCTEMEIGTSSKSEIVEIKSPTKYVIDKKGRKFKKLTNLAKYRKKCENRKYKIKRETPPLMKPIKKPKQVRLIKHITERDTSATLNDTQVYAKAVKVMAELNAKTKAKDCKELKCHISQGEENDEKHRNDANCQSSAASNNNSALLKSPKSTATISAPFIVSEGIKSPVFLKEPVVIIRRCSTENMILSPNGISRKLSIKSPELSANSPVTMKSVNFAFDDLKHTLTSPEPTNPSLKQVNTCLGNANTETVSSTSNDITTFSEITDQSVKLAIASRRRSNRSPVPHTQYMDYVITSPKHRINSPEMNSPKKLTITSPNRSIKSPEMNSSTKLAITSPNRSIKSPKMNSPTKPTITSSNRSVKSPDMNSPTKLIITSPNRSIKSPDMKSPTKLTITSNRCIKSPEMNSPTKLTITSPNRSIKSPKMNSSTQLTVTSPNRSIKSPELKSLTKFTITSPNRFIKSDMNSPTKLTIPSPNLFEYTVTSCKKTGLLSPLGHSPKSPQFPMASREFANTLSNHLDKIPENIVLRSHRSVTSPKAAFTFPNRSINGDGLSRLTANTFELPISSSNPNETALTPFKPSESVLKSPKPAIVTRSSSITSSVCGITSPKLSNMPSNLTSTSSRITRSQSKHENDLIEDWSMVLQRDEKVQNTAQNKHTPNENNVIENKYITEKNSQLKRKRTQSSGSDLQNRKISRRMPLINEGETTTGSNGNVENTNANSSRISNEKNLSSWDSKESVLCVMMEKYGLKTIKPNSRSVPGAVLNKISDLINKSLLKLKESTGNETVIMNELVAEFETYDYKVFVSGLIHYLVSPDRKMELFGKTSMLAAPSMTKAEQVLLYVLRQLRHYWSPVDMVEFVLSTIENTIFKLNRTPDFNVVESVSHFYALVCRYFGLKSRLIVYMLDAMYCIQFKAVPLIKQCLDVWPHVIPLAHMSIAKNPLVTCFVYLLHFYKCEDKYSRVQDIRNMLYRQYFYQFTDWNERKILEIFQNAITDLRDVPFEKKILRIALIILGKRHGPRWTQNNIIKKILQPLIDTEKVSNNIKAFCISMIGPLMKPYPADMKANCEFAMNQLMDIKNNANSKEIEEAAMCSLVIMHRHNHRRVIEILLQEKMRPMSPDLEDLICHLIRTKPTQAWLNMLSRMPLFDND